MRVPLSPHSHEHLGLPVFVSVAILGRHLIVVLIGFSLMSNHSGHLFLCLFGYLHIFFGKVPIKIVWSFLIGLFVFLLLICKRSSYILNKNHLSGIWFSQILPPFLWVSFHLFDGVIWSTKVFNFNEVQFVFFFPFFAYDFGVIS